MPKPIITICISVKNRSRIIYKNRQLFPLKNCIESLAKIAKKINPIELIIADFKSNDWPLNTWVYKETNALQINIITVDGNFSRGKGLNIAADKAASKLLFLCDVDMLIPIDLFSYGIELAIKGKPFFPAFRYLDINNNPKNLEPFNFRNVFIPLTIFKDAGGVPEFESWGGEDIVFRDCVNMNTPFIREPFKDFNHQWHPDYCRHENYTNAKYNDYNDYKKRQINQTKTKYFEGDHPRWNGTIILHANGRLERPNVDVGNYKLDMHEKVILQWDNWPAETLYWDETSQLYSDQAKQFTLQEKSQHYVKNKRIYLFGGLGNRINTILNHIHELDSYEFYWAPEHHCNMPWQRLFDNIPIKFTNQCNKFWEEVDPWHFRWMQDDVRRTLAIKFLRSLRPSDEVQQYLRNDLTNTDGYYIRALHPHSNSLSNIIIPNGVYLATDSFVVRMTNPKTLQLEDKNIGGKFDLDPNIRCGVGMVAAVADWFNLMSCRRIYEYGVSYSSMTTIHSTFLDGCRILGKEIIQIKQ